MTKQKLYLVSLLAILILAITVLSGCLSLESLKKTANQQSKPSERTQTTDFLTYECSAFRIKYPAYWVKNELVKGISVKFSVSKNEAYPGAVCVTTQGFSGQPPTLDEYAAFQINQIKKYIEDANILESRKTILATYPAHKVVYTGKGIGEHDIKTMSIWIIKKNKAYEISYNANVDNFPDFLGIAQEMIYSFEFHSR